MGYSSTAPGLANWPKNPRCMSQLLRFNERHMLDHAAVTAGAPWLTIVETTAGDGWDLAKGIVANNARACVQDDSTNANDQTEHTYNLAAWNLNQTGSVLEFCVGAYFLLATTSAFAAGLVVKSDGTTGLDKSSAPSYVVDGILFKGDVSGAGLDLILEKDGADTTYTNHYTDQATLSAATWHEMAFRVMNHDGTNFEIWAYLDGDVISHKHLTSGVPNDVNLGYHLSHRGAAGNYVRWSHIGAALYQPGEYVA